MAFTAQDVKNLREQTGCGMMDCKKALTEAGGDFEKAVEYLREKGLAAAQKKAGRIAAEGMVYATVEGNVGVVLEVNAETDFVAKNELFQTFVKDVAAVVIEQNPADVDALLACKMGNDTVEAALKDKILVIGENIKIRRFVRYEGVCSAYIHAGERRRVRITRDHEGRLIDVLRILPHERYFQIQHFQIATVGICQRVPFGNQAFSRMRETLDEIGRHMLARRS